MNQKMITFITSFATLLLMLFAVVGIGISAAAPINAVDVTVSPDIECANGRMAKGSCPNGEDRPAPVVPMLYFSDLNSGPDSGWSTAEPDKGVAVTIYGRNLGATRGSNYVTVNGVRLEADSDYPDTWGEFNDPVPHLQRVTFHLKASMPDGPGTISVTTTEGTSNTLPFTIRSGRILFVDEAVAQGSGSGTLTDPLSPYDLFSQEQVGDTIYFRGGLYDQKYGTGHANFYMTYVGTAGTAANPIALVGYPGEVAMFDTATNGNTNDFYIGMSTIPVHYTISRLHFDCLSECLRTDSYTRVVGNDFEAMKAYTNGSAHVINYNNGSYVAGNSMHGGRSQQRLDHAYYAQGCPDVEGNRVEHNYIYDNDLAEGPLIVVNHQQNRCSNTQQAKSHYISSNIVNCETYGGRAIGIYDLSWDDSSIQFSDGQDTAGEPEPTYVYNNITYRCGAAVNNASLTAVPSLEQDAAHARFYNNLVLEDRSDHGIQVGNYRVITSEVRNNIITMMDASYRPLVFDDVGGVMTASNNLYFNSNTTSTSTASGSLFLGTDYVIGDPLITLQFTPTFEISIGAGSPALGAGTSVPVVSGDFFNNSLLDPRSIGPIEVAQ